MLTNDNVLLYFIKSDLKRQFLNESRKSNCLKCFLESFLIQHLLPISESQHSQIMEVEADHLIKNHLIFNFALNCFTLASKLS